MSDIYKIIEKLENENNKFKEEINLLKSEEKKIKEILNIKDKEIISVKNELNNIKNENIKIIDKMKYLEEKLNNINKNDIIKDDKEDKNQNKPQPIIHHRPKCEYQSVPNYIDNNININKNKKPKNEIIEEDDDEEHINKIKEKKEEKKNDIAKNKIKDSDLSLSKKTKSEPIKINLENIDFDRLFTSSKIITSKKEKTNLYTWMATKCGHILEIKLLFQSSKDGDSYDTFFEKCGEKGPTLSVIKSKNNKKFGGFSKAQWTNKKGKIQLKDENAFVYSLDKLEKYDVLEPDIAISCHPDFLLMYGNNNNRYGLRIVSSFLEGKNNYENFGKKSYNVPAQFTLTGENLFIVEELEIFQIIFA